MSTISNVEEAMIARGLEVAGITHENNVIAKPTSMPDERAIIGEQGRHFFEASGPRHEHR